MKNINLMKFACILIWAVAVTTSCGSSRKAADGKDENTGVLTLSYEVIKAKVNGVEYERGSKLVLPVGKNEFEVVFLLAPQGGLLRAATLGFKKHTVVGKIQLDVEKGKKYTLIAQEGADTRIPAAVIGVFVPVGSYEFKILHKVKFVGTFPAMMFEGEAWDAYQYPMIQSEE